VNRQTPSNFLADHIEREKRSPPDGNFVETLERLTSAIPGYTRYSSSNTNSKMAFKSQVKKSR
jgi:hypothetical protein